MKRNPWFLALVVLMTSSAFVVETTHSAPSTSAPSTSQGFYSRGTLVQGVPVPQQGPNHRLLLPARCLRPARAHFYGHSNTVAAVLDVAAEMRRRQPQAPKLAIGDLSSSVGGSIPGHLSHQNGLDVDVFFLAAKPRKICHHGPSFEAKDATSGKWAVTEDFNAAWNWHLAAAFAARRDVKVIFSGGLIKRRLAAWAKANKVPRSERLATLNKLHAVYCRAPKGRKLGTYRNNYCPHDDHFHVRFRCPKGSPGCREKRW